MHAWIRAEASTGFSLLPFGYSAQSRLFVHGIRAVEGVPNDAVAGSGLPLRQLDRLHRAGHATAAGRHESERLMHESAKITFN
jgi:hypothetical protein